MACGGPVGGSHMNQGNRDRRNRPHGGGSGRFGRSPGTVRKRHFEPPAPAPGQAVRMAAASAISGILASGRTLDDYFAADLSSQMLAGLEPRDIALVRSIVVAAMRRLGTIRLALDRFVERRPPARAQALEGILIAGVAQILFLDVPDHSAVDLAVRSAKHEAVTVPFAAMTNAVLRNVIRHREELLTVEPIADTPGWMAARWSANWGRETAEQIALAHRREPALDLTLAGDPQEWAEKLNGMVLPNGSVRLRDRTPVQQLEGYDAGQWWVQDCAASLPAQILAPQAGENIADLCAAPGGKTAQLASAGAQVIAIDRSAERLKRLHENMQRLRLNVEVRASDALTYSGGPFDAILLDAPCTATGTIRRHPEVAWIKRQSDLEALVVLQTKLLDHAASLLKPGGRLIYCTCSLEPEEGENQIASLLRRNPDVERIPVTAPELDIFGRHENTGTLAEAISESGDVRTFPHFLPRDEARMGGIDGFFVARLKRLR